MAGNSMMKMCSSYPKTRIGRYLDIISSGCKYEVFGITDVITGEELAEWLENFSLKMSKQT